MAVVFSRFSSLGTSHFRSVCLGQRVAELRDELDHSREIVQWQCLSTVVMLTTIAYLLTRGFDSLWAIGLMIPIITIGGASLQHALTLYRTYVHAHVMPSLCEAFGRLRHTMGKAPDLYVDQLVKAGLLPAHDRHLIDDVFFGDYRGHQLTLALINIWHRIDVQPDAQGRWSRAVVMVIKWPTKPAHLPADELTKIIDDENRPKLAWSDGDLMLTIPCSASPFELGGLFEPPDRFVRRMEQVAAMIEMPPNLIDYLLDEPSSPTRSA